MCSFLSRVGHQYMLLKTPARHQRQWIDLFFLLSRRPAYLSESDCNIQDNRHKTPGCRWTHQALY